MRYSKSRNRAGTRCRKVIGTILFSVFLPFLSAQEYFFSNENMLEIRSISASDINTYQFVLKKEPIRKKVQRSTLYQDGVIYRVAYTEFTEEGRIIYSRLENGKSEVILRKKYTYDTEGNPRRIKRTLQDGTVELILFNTGVDSNRRNVMQGEFGSVYEREYYSEDGKKLFLERWDGGMLVFKETLKYMQGTLYSSIAEDYLTGLQNKSEYIAGLVSIERSYKGTQLLSETHYTYDNENRVSTELVITEGEKRESRYNYDEDGKITQVIETKSGIPVRIVEYLPESEKVELLYREGRLILRREYSGEIPTVEYHYSKDGRVSNQRILRSTE